MTACSELVEKNQMDACYLRPMVIRGYGAAGMVPFDSPIDVYLPCWPWGAYLGEGALENGVDACVSSWHRMAPNTIPAMAKVAGNYLSGQLVKMEALANGSAEANRTGPGRTPSARVWGRTSSPCTGARSLPRLRTERCSAGSAARDTRAHARTGLWISPCTSGPSRADVVCGR